MRASIDTNVWVSSFLNRRGGPARLRAAYLAGRFTVIVSEPRLAELEEVLTRPRFAQLGVSHDEVTSLLEVLRDRGLVVPIARRLQVCRDPDDDVVIETAIEGKADVLVSGDHDLTQMAEVAECLTRAGVRVVTVRQFLQELNEP